MTDLERMAREAGAFTPGKAGDYWAVTEEALARFAALIRADERERCAKVCDAVDAERATLMLYADDEAVALAQAAAAIRGAA